MRRMPRYSQRMDDFEAMTPSESTVGRGVVVNMKRLNGQLLVQPFYAIRQ